MNVNQVEREPLDRMMIDPSSARGLPGFPHARHYG